MVSVFHWQSDMRVKWFRSFLMFMRIHYFLSGWVAVIILVLGVEVCFGCVVDGDEGSVRVRYFEPSVVRIDIDDLPEPYASRSARKGPRVIAVPEDPVLEVPSGFGVQVFADKVPAARWLALTPAGDVLCASSRTNTIYLFKDTDKDGLADKRFVFLDKERGCNLPFGMAFANGGFYLGNTNGIYRYDYEPGTTSLTTKGMKITDLPGRGYAQHWTRNIAVSKDEKYLFITVGSKSNVGEEDPPRASILRMKLDGSDREVYASGLRNPVGMDINPITGEVFVVVNERDGLGDDLVPDYFTRVRKDEFFGWPYAYLKPNRLDPRMLEVDDETSRNPQLAAKTRTPDILFQSHSAPLGMAIYDGMMFPEKYRGGAFVAFHGSWNRSSATGYKIVFVPFNSETHEPKGGYEDFVRGFLTDPSGPTAWGRPVGIVVMKDGSVLFADDGNGRIYRVYYDET